MAGKSIYREEESYLTLRNVIFFLSSIFVFFLYFFFLFNVTPRIDKRTSPNSCNPPRS